VAVVRGDCSKTRPALRLVQAAEPALFQVAVLILRYREVGCWSKQPIAGSDLLVSGHCRHCGKALSALLTPTPRAGLDPSEYFALLGALGVLVGLALTSSPENSAPSNCVT
jgi:hypothetical protein